MKLHDFSIPKTEQHPPWVLSKGLGVIDSIGM